MFDVISEDVNADPEDWVSDLSHAYDESMETQYETCDYNFAVDIQSPASEIEALLESIETVIGYNDPSSEFNQKNLANESASRYLDSSDGVSSQYDHWIFHSFRYDLNTWYPQLQAPSGEMNYLGASIRQTTASQYILDSIAGGGVFSYTRVDVWSSCSGDTIVNDTKTLSDYTDSGIDETGLNSNDPLRIVNHIIALQDNISELVEWQNSFFEGTYYDNDSFEMTGITICVNTFFDTMVSNMTLTTKDGIEISDDIKRHIINAYTPLL